MKEREQFKYTMLAQSSLQIQLSGTTGLNNQIYNFPLTVDITVPPDWQSVIIRQGAKTDTVNTTTSGSTTYIRTKIIPDGTTITLNKKANVTAWALTGSVTYDNATVSKIKNVSVAISGSNGYNAVVTTDTSGNFSVSGLAAGTYSVSLTKSDGFSSVNATDALIVLRYFAGLVQFDSLQTLSGDVNNDAVINSTDALQIIRRFVGNINSFARPDWIFMPQTINVNLTQNTNLTIKSIITGDVNKSYMP